MSSEKKVVCITGTLWTGSRSAPRHLLVKEGFVRPVWFTTARRVTDAVYRQIEETTFHQALARDEVLVHLHYGGAYMGIMKGAFSRALESSERGVLVVGPPEIAAGLAEKVPHTVVFAFKDAAMELSPLLARAKNQGQLHRIDVDVLAAGAWTLAYDAVSRVLGPGP